MVLELVLCPDCDGSDVVKHGTSKEGKQRYNRQIELIHPLFSAADSINLPLWLQDGWANTLRVS